MSCTSNQLKIISLKASLQKGLLAMQIQGNHPQLQVSVCHYLSAMHPAITFFHVAPSSRITRSHAKASRIAAEIGVHNFDAASEEEQGYKEDEEDEGSSGEEKGEDSSSADIDDIPIHLLKRSLVYRGTIFLLMPGISLTLLNSLLSLASNHQGDSTSQESESESGRSR